MVEVNCPPSAFPLYFSLAGTREKTGRVITRGAGAHDRRGVQGVLLLPGRLPTRAWTVSVSLIDATVVDRAAPVLVSTTFAVPDVGIDEIPFHLDPLPARPRRRRWVFTATVTADPSGRLAAGDYLLARSVEWPEGDAPEQIRLALQKVS